MGSHYLLVTFALVMALGVDLIYGQLDSQISKDGPMDKRAQGFMPMRGRKAAFTPMRGKKAPMSPMDMEQWFEEMKRAQGFMPMRGRKSDLSFDYGYPVVSYGDDSNNKRAAFQAVRGKKDFDENELEADKRAAFQAVRGKKQYSAPETAAGWMEGQSNADLEKRANAFFGMRGKRSAGILH